MSRTRRPPLLQRARARMRARAARRATRTRRGIPARAALPSIITLLGLCAGLTAIRFAIEGKFDVAIAAIGAAAVLDALDGRMARLLDATSRFGAELDSLADFVDFGVAPALVIYLWAFPDVRSIGWIVTLVFVLAAALRLARFNVAIDAERAAWQAAFFSGVPTPAGALLLLLPLYLEGLGLIEPGFAQPVIMAYVVAVAGLMVSRLPTFSSKLLVIDIAREDLPRILVPIVAVIAFLVTYPYLTLTVLAAAYLVSLPVSARRHARARALAVAGELG